MFFFFLNDTATTEIYTLSLHDALPIWLCAGIRIKSCARRRGCLSNPDYDRLPPADNQLTESSRSGCGGPGDRKSTRLNSSHSHISYAGFCLKKKTSQPTRIDAPTMTPA